MNICTARQKRNGVKKTTFVHTYINNNAYMYAYIRIDTDTVKCIRSNLLSTFRLSFKAMNLMRQLTKFFKL